LKKYKREEEKEMIGEKWMKWTLAEAGTRTSSKMFQKIIGTICPSFAHTFFAAWVVGLVQIIGGFVMARVCGKKILTDKISILGSCLFGLIAGINTVLPFIIFLLRGDIGINVFIITLAIVPGALIDKFFFGYKLNRVEWFGISIAIFAGYSILNWPSLSEFVKLPLWVWLSTINMFLVAINQGITQKIKIVNPFVKNFWGGLTTCIFALGGLAVLDALPLITDFSGSMPKLWVSATITGCIVIGFWSFNLMSYKRGASIALKKLVMNSAYLTTAMLLGVLIFKEPFTTAKISGMFFYLIAFCLMDRETRSFLKQILATTRV
jgi:drug/metabolite transporter (DMT)-like permease